MCVSAQFHREDGWGSGFGSWKTVPAVPVPRPVPAKTVPAGSGFRFRFGSWATPYIMKFSRELIVLCNEFSVIACKPRA